MSDIFAMAAVTHYAFGPSPDSTKGTPDRIHIVFEDPAGLQSWADTDLMDSTPNSMVGFYDRLCICQDLFVT